MWSALCNVTEPYELGVVPDVGIRVEGDETLLEIPGSDGLSRQLVLRPAG